MNPTRLLFGAGICALLLSACAAPEKEEAAAPLTLAGCYSSQVGADVAYLNLDVLEDRVGGTLEYAFAQKDNSWGIVTGPVGENELVLEYQYLSEGLLSTRTLTLKREDAELSGEGFTYKPTAQCGSGEGWTETAVSNVAADMFHDPETGYYARVHFNVAGPVQGYRYRCIATVTKADGNTIVQWVGEGITDETNAMGRQNLQTNIRPDQVKELDNGRVACQVKAVN